MSSKFEIKFNWNERNLLFFAADYHFFHHNIIKYDNRPYTTIQEMHEDIIRKHNEIVPEHGIIFMLGDIVYSTNKTRISKDSFMDMMNKMNGKKYFIMGNHDKFIKHVLHKHELHERINLKIKLPVHLRNEKNTYQKIVLDHYPLEEWDGSSHGTLHLHGHSHGKMRIRKNRIDVGIANNNYYPWSFEQVINIIKHNKSILNTETKKIIINNE